MRLCSAGLRKPMRDGCEQSYIKFGVWHLNQPHKHDGYH